MLPEFADEEFSAALDEVVGEFLADVDWHRPPVDLIELARRADIVVAVDTQLASRARTVRLAATPSASSASILLRPEPRAERRQWAVAHELGEQLAERVFMRLAVTPGEAAPGAREHVANLLAGRLLLPIDWFECDARSCGWDLFALKSRYATASHELIARRLLDLAPPVIISVFDQQQLTWRKSNLPGRPPPLLPAEQACLRQVRALGSVVAVAAGATGVQGWPIHEPGWQREILRTDCEEA